VSQVRYSASAENDLLEAWLFVAEDSIVAADQLLDQIQADSRTLLLQPKMGRARDELAVGLHSWPTSTPISSFILLMTTELRLHASCTTPEMFPRPGTGQGAEDARQGPCFAERRCRAGAHLAADGQGHQSSLVVRCGHRP
jgi:plasmid stabilization system protein ParE